MYFTSKLVLSAGKEEQFNTLSFRFFLNSESKKVLYLFS